MDHISEETFDEKYALYSDLVFRIAFVYLKNRADAEDVLQEVFVKLFYKAPAFAATAAEKAWIVKVTVNCCKNVQSNFWKRKIDLTDTFADIPDFSGEDRTVMEELMALAPHYRTVIYLHYIEGYGINEIAHILKISPSAVKMRLSRGREKLKKSLQEDLS